MESKDGYFADLEEMYAANYKLVRLFAKDQGLDGEDIEDVVSTVWLKVMEHFAECSEMDIYRLHNYLRKLTKHIAIDLFRAQKAAAKAIEDTRILKESSSSLAYIDEELFHAGREDYLDTAISILSADEMMLIELKYVKQLNAKQIGDMLAISDVAVRARLSRISRKLKAEIVRLMYENGDVENER